MLRALCAPAGTWDLFITLDLVSLLTDLGLGVSVPTNWVSAAFLPDKWAQPCSAVTGLLAWCSIP